MIDLQKIKTIHFIGIKGVAMAGLAVICQQRGITVKGSDVAEKFITDETLAQAQIELFENFDQRNLDWQPELVVVGSSWGDDHAEIVAARTKGIPIISDSELRGLLSREKKTITVTGVHGKTTTTAMLAHIFQQADLKPSFLVGTGRVPDLGSNAAWQAGSHFIVEGDEYSRSYSDHTPKFLDLDPAISIITSLEWEHVDIYDSEAAIEAVFKKLVAHTKDLVVACIDWPGVERVIAGATNTATYGINGKGLWQAYDITQTPAGMQFKVKKGEAAMGEFSIRLFGQHNVSNALGCIIIALHQGITIDLIQQALSIFQGSQRRFEVTEHNGITFVDDYGHHPSEIKATLEAVRQRYKDKKIICVFQPHMASRTRALLKNFATSFASADTVLVTDIFASAREKSEAITAKDLAAAIAVEHQNVSYSGSIASTTEQLRDLLAANSVVVTMGAGNVYEVRDSLVAD